MAREKEAPVEVELVSSGTKAYIYVNDTYVGVLCFAKAEKRRFLGEQIVEFYSREGDIVGILHGRSAKTGGRIINFTKKEETSP